MLCEDQGYAFAEPPDGHGYIELPSAPRDGIGAADLLRSPQPLPDRGLTFDSNRPHGERYRNGRSSNWPLPIPTWQWMRTAQSVEQLTFSLTVTPESLEALARPALSGTRTTFKHHPAASSRTNARSSSTAHPEPAKPIVAQELAHHFARAEDRTDLVQFHPSYAYEDFVEGFRPDTIRDQPGFKLREGPLKRIADQARANPDSTHVLVIDEINRGNVARVFGELYFLLEYRGREISLQYSDTEFALPDNLWFIATMNTADRSIALVDAALRRRFHFVEFSPHTPPVQGLLTRWLETRKARPPLGRQVAEPGQRQTRRPPPGHRPQPLHARRPRREVGRTDLESLDLSVCRRTTLRGSGSPRRVQFETLRAPQPLSSKTRSPDNDDDGV